MTCPRSYNLLVTDYLAGDTWLIGQDVFSVQYTAFTSSLFKMSYINEYPSFCKVLRVSKVRWLHWQPGQALGCRQHGRMAEMADPLSMFASHCPRVQKQKSYPLGKYSPGKRILSQCTLILTQRVFRVKTDIQRKFS